ncbi:uncharacterized protein LOC144120825 isoform X1 [Amblyomma americanum]
MLKMEDPEEATLHRAEDGRSTDEGPSLLCLPDLVLHKVCLQLSDPFDVLSLGCTCHQLHQLTASKSLWTRLALAWCRGMWHRLSLPSDSDPEDPKQWLLQVLHLCTKERRPTLKHCKFENGETWERIRRTRFDCKVAMLSCAYKGIDERVSPFVLLRRWVYDVALYNRQNPGMQFSGEKPVLGPDNVSELAALGRARQSDLRGRKQPNVHPRFYVSCAGTSVSSWTEDLFPSGPAGSICPILVCPFQRGYSFEWSGVDGLLTCVSHVLEQHLARACLDGRATLAWMASTIRLACESLEKAFFPYLRGAYDLWPVCPVGHAIISMAEEGWPDMAAWQVQLATLGLNWREVMSECAELLRKHETLDAIVDEARIRWRRSLLADIEAVLHCTCCDSPTVTRINLTDSDAIGGDNSRQDMAAAAFVSCSGVLVTWQLLGRGSY